MSSLGVHSRRCLLWHFTHPSPVYSPNLSDMERLKTLVKMSASSLAVNVANSGHNYAMTAASSCLSPSARLNELLTGMSQVSIYPAHTLYAPRKWYLNDWECCRMEGNA